MVTVDAAEAATASPDPFLIALVAVGGVVIGSVLSGLFALLSASIENKRQEARWLRDKAMEEARWLRDNRMESYANYLDVLRQAILTAAKTGVVPLSSDVTRTSTRLTLLGPDSVSVAANAVVAAMTKEFNGKVLTPTQGLEALERVDALDTDLTIEMMKVLSGED